MDFLDFSLFLSNLSFYTVGSVEIVECGRSENGMGSVESRECGRNKNGIGSVEIKE